MGGRLLGSLLLVLSVPGCFDSVGAGLPDASPRDGGAPDSGPRDSGAPDDGAPDGGVLDGGPRDSGVDAGIPGALRIAPAARAFGVVTLGERSAPQAFTIDNIGDGPTGPISVALRGVDPGELEIVADDCSGRMLRPGASCVVMVDYHPATAGDHTATLDVSADPGGTVSASLAGRAVSGAILEIGPPAFDFGPVAVGTSSSRTYTVTNTGTASTGVLAVTLSGPAVSDFEITSDSCSGTLLAAGTSCSVIVTYRPGMSGDPIRSVLLQVSDGSLSTSAMLTGTIAYPTELTITPSFFDFRMVPVGSLSAAQIFTVFNPGSSATGVAATAISGGYPSDFLFVSGRDGCNGRAIPAFGSCTISVQFQPSASGARDALLIVSVSPGRYVTASLTGTGGGGEIELIPATGHFGEVAVGLESADIVFSVRNIGTDLVGRPAPSIGPGSAFRITSDGCTAPIPAGGSCSVSVRFAPTSAGLHVASLQVTAMPGGTAVSDLSGTGIYAP